jgi:Tol biopolymer transport system component
VTSGCNVPTLAEHKVDWSPDGTQLAFVRRDESRNLQISVIDDTGTAERQLTSGASGSRHPDWSPDGTRIAYTVQESSSTCPEPNSNIFVMDVSEGDRQRLTEGCGEGNRMPDWSPDGTRILFTSERSGAAQLYVMQADGTGETKLADGEASYAKWSPDGERIAFVRGAEVWVMDADGSDQTVVYDRSQWFVTGPEWSPDGSRIIFTDGERLLGTGTAEDEVLILDLATRTVVSLTKFLGANINCCASWRR